MAQRVRIISGSRNKAFDHYIEDIIERGAWRQEHTYFGIADQDRANFVRQKIRTAGTHMDPRVAVKAFWYECPGCENGGPDCRYHVSFTVFDMEEARKYKANVQNTAARTMS